MPKQGIVRGWAQHRASSDGRKWSAYPAGNGVSPITGLIYPSNGVAGGDIGLDWTGAAMLPRWSHTSIWKALYVQQSGYYASDWHCYADNTWNSGIANGGHEYGTHPYPSDGTHVDGYAVPFQTTVIHYHEIANGNDKISDGGDGLLVEKDVWLTQARTCEQVGSNYVHKFWPDVENNPAFVITWVWPVASVTGSPTLKFRKGCSPWTGNGSTNSETPSGIQRHWLQYDAALTFAEIEAKAALVVDDTTDSRRWYSNLNPTPTDVTDKSGKGHNPAWANSNRPTLYTG